MFATAWRLGKGATGALVRVDFDLGGVASSPEIDAERREPASDVPAREPPTSTASLPGARGLAGVVVGR